MKCEICQKADAATVLIRETGAGEEELYVCKACAAAERKRRQKKSQRTRKMTGLPPGVSMSITEVSSDGGEPPPFIAAIMDAMNGMVEDLEKKMEAEKSTARKKKPALYEFPCVRVPKEFRYGGLLHLEGLHLIGELEAVQRAMHALGYQLEGRDADGVKSTGHAYRFLYKGSLERAKRVISDLLTQERNARVRLVEEMPRVLGDSLCRALAILKNCRLLSPGELFDLLSPLRLAALEKALDGLTLAALEKLAASLDLSNAEDKLDQPERDRVDGERADEMNARFEDVVLNERGEGRFL